jgi:hypothetical protein
VIELEQLRQLADIAAIVGDRDGAVRLHILIGAIERLLIRLDALELTFGIEPIGTQPERRLKA